MAGQTRDDDWSECILHPHESAANLADYLPERRAYITVRLVNTEHNPPSLPSTFPDAVIARNRGQPHRQSRSLMDDRS